MVAPRFPREIQPTVLKWAPHPYALRLRGSHPLWRPIPGNFGFGVSGCILAPTSNSTSPSPFRRGVRFELCRFHSPLLTASRLISFPAPTKMFQFGAFPLPQPKLTGAPDGRNSHSGILGSTAPCAYPRLFAAWHALLRRPEPSHPPGGITPAASFLSTSPVDVGAVKCL